MRDVTHYLEEVNASLATNGMPPGRCLNASIGLVYRIALDFKLEHVSNL